MINDDVKATKDLEEETNDPDSGLVDDYLDSQLLSEAFNVLPDERTLSVDYDLELDLCDENFGTYKDVFFESHEVPSVKKKANDYKTKNDDSFSNTDSYENINENVQKTIKVLPGKYTEFTKEQARQWRRKRILNSHNQNAKLKSEKSYMTLPNKPKNPLCNAPNKPTVQEKLKDPLLGGEKIGANRAPVPMKLRALPLSFWKEPQRAHTSSLAGSHYSILPPLFATETSTIHDVRPVTPPEEKGRSPRQSPSHKKKVVGGDKVDTALLFSLFDHLESKIDDRLVVKRGRPKKLTTDQRPINTTKDKDPCIVDALADKLFPELSIQQAKEKRHNLAAIVKIKKGKSPIVELPGIQQSYSEMLSELITHM